MMKKGLEMSVEAGAAGAVKYWGLPVIGAAFASALLFMFLPPKTPKEWLVRLTCTLIGSFLFGPLAVVTAMHFMPWIVSAAPDLATRFGLPLWHVQLSLYGPFYVLAGVPSWYVLGLLVRMAERNYDRDAGTFWGFILRALGRYVPPHNDGSAAQ